MNDEERKELARRIAVMQAALDGKEIECQWRGKSQWVDRLPVTCHFEWPEWDYRVKPDAFEAWWKENALTPDEERSFLRCFTEQTWKPHARLVWSAAVKAAKEGK